MSTKRRSDPVIPAAGFAAPVPPLGGADLAHMRRAMAEIAPDWAVELEGICSGEATLVVVPEDGDDTTGPSFVISRETYGLRVSELHWDLLSEVGVFASLNDVVSALQLRLAFCIDAIPPVTVTVH